MATTIWPSYTDLGNFQGAGNRVTEESLQSALNAVSGIRNGVIDGMDVEINLWYYVRIATGQCLINGYYVSTDENINILHPSDGGTYFFYIYLVRDAQNRVTGVNGAVLASISTSSDYLLVAKAAGNVSGIYDLDDEREFLSGIISSRYGGDGTVDRDIDLGRTPSLVIIGSESGTTTQMLSISQIDAPGNRRAVNSETCQSRVYFAPAAQTIATDWVKVLEGSTDFTTSISDSSGGTKDISVSGAAVGDYCYVCHDDTDFYNTRLLKNNEVSSSGTVTLRYYNMSGGTIVLSGDIHAVVLKQQDDIEVDCRMIANTIGSAQCPTIIDDGFRVTASTFPALNNSGITYNYIAFL